MAYFRFDSELEGPEEEEGEGRREIDERDVVPLRVQDQSNQESEDHRNVLVAEMIIKKVQINIEL